MYTLSSIKCRKFIQHAQHFLLFKSILTKKKRCTGSLNLHFILGRSIYIHTTSNSFSSHLDPFCNTINWSLVRGTKNDFMQKVIFIDRVNSCLLFLCYCAHLSFSDSSSMISSRYTIFSFDDGSGAIS
jgi:hypothetical protein